MQTYCALCRLLQRKVPVTPLEIILALNVDSPAHRLPVRPPLFVFPSTVFLSWQPAIRPPTPVLLFFFFLRVCVYVFHQASLSPNCHLFFSAQSDSPGEGWSLENWQLTSGWWFLPEPVRAPWGQRPRGSGTCLWPTSSDSSLSRTAWLLQRGKSCRVLGGPSAHPAHW